MQKAESAREGAREKEITQGRALEQVEEGAHTWLFALEDLSIALVCKIWSSIESWTRQLGAESASVPDHRCGGWYRSMHG